MDVLWFRDVVRSYVSQLDASRNESSRIKASKCPGRVRFPRRRQRLGAVTHALAPWLLPEVAYKYERK
jgi:hypothetical protein